MHLEHLRIDFYRIAQPVDKQSVGGAAGNKDPRPRSTQTADSIDEVLGFALLEIGHVVDRNERMGFVLKLIGDNLELHKELASNRVVCLDNPNRPSRRVRFNLLHVLQQYRRLTKPVGRVKQNDSCLAPLNDELVHQAIAPHHIVAARRHQLEAVRIAQIIYHTCSSTRPYGHRSCRTI